MMIMIRADKLLTCISMTLNSDSSRTSQTQGPAAWLAGGMRHQVASLAAVYGKAVTNATHKNSNRLSAEERDAHCTPMYPRVCSSQTSATLAPPQARRFSTCVTVFIELDRRAAALKRSTYRDLYGWTFRSPQTSIQKQVCGGCKF
jgi:hypothetical protein